MENQQRNSPVRLGYILIISLLFVLSVRECYATSNTTKVGGLNREVDSVVAGHNGVYAAVNTYSYNNIDNPHYEAEKGHKGDLIDLTQRHVSSGITEGPSTTDKFIIIPTSYEGTLELGPEVVAKLDSLMFLNTFDTAMNKSLELLEKDSENNYLFRLTVLETIESLVKEQERSKEAEAIAYLLWVLLFLISLIGTYLGSIKKNRFIQSLGALFLILSVYGLIVYYPNLYVWL